MMRMVKGMIMRGLVTLVNSSLKMQAMQLQGLGAMTLDSVENFEPYGFTAAALPGAEGIILNVGAHAGNAVVICVADRRYRLSGLAGGEVAVYDNQGQSVVLYADHIGITSPYKVVVSAPETDIDCPIVNINSSTINLGGADGHPVARVGDSVDPTTMKIVSGSTVVSAL